MTNKMVNTRGEGGIQQLTCSWTVGVPISYLYNFSIEKWPLSILIGSFSNKSEAIVTVQTALSSNYCFFQKNG